MRRCILATPTAAMVRPTEVALAFTASSSRPSMASDIVPVYMVPVCTVQAYMVQAYMVQILITQIPIAQPAMQTHYLDPPSCATR